MFKCEFDNHSFAANLELNRSETLSSYYFNCMFSGLMKMARYVNHTEKKMLSKNSIDYKTKSLFTIRKTAKFMILEQVFIKIKRNILTDAA